MTESLIIGYGVVLDDESRVMLLRRRSHETLWPGSWWLPGGVTPLDEEPDHTVPRIFEHLLRQQVRVAYVHTVFGEEPSSGRHTVHNAYLTTVEEALDGAPDDETNPFDALEWWDLPSALTELPPPQAELLNTVVERLDQHWDFDAVSNLDDLLDGTMADLTVSPPSPASISPQHVALTRFVARIAASNALGQDANWEADLHSAHSLGWTWSELEQVAQLAAELGRSASLECAPTIDEET